MSDKLTAALVNLEKARNAALEAAIAERAYRLCVVLDGDGSVQRGINRAASDARAQGEEGQVTTPRAVPSGTAPLTRWEAV